MDDIEQFDERTNKTIIIKALPLSSWFPFDEQKYYVQTYWLQILDGCIGASFVTYTDIFTFSLIIFPLGQMRILNHMLSNFQKYASKVKEELDCSQEEASFVTFRECILQHKKIVR